MDSRYFREHHADDLLLSIRQLYPGRPARPWRFQLSISFSAQAVSDQISAWEKVGKNEFDWVIHWVIYAELVTCNPTYWMPLPSPPLIHQPRGDEDSEPRHGRK